MIWRSAIASWKMPNRQHNRPRRIRNGEICLCHELADGLGEASEAIAALTLVVCDVTLVS